MKRILIFFITMIIIFLSGCESTTTNISYMDYENLKTQSEDYYIIDYFGDDFDTITYMLYDIKSGTLLHKVESADQSHHWMDAVIYEDYLIVKERSDDTIYSIAVYDIQTDLINPIKRFYETNRLFVIQQSDHYLIINDTLESIGTTHNNIVYFLDLNNLSSWESETGYAYTVESESESVIWYSKAGEYIRSNIYAFYRYGDIVNYGPFLEQEVTIYSSHIDTLFTDDQMLYSVNDLHINDTFQVRSDFIIHMDYNYHDIYYEAIILDKSGNYFDEEFIVFNKLSAKDNNWNWLGNGFFYEYDLRGNHLVVLDNYLSEEEGDNVRFWISTLEGSQWDIKTQTFLLDTDIPYRKNVVTHFFVYGETIHL